LKINESHETQSNQDQEKPQTNKKKKMIIWGLIAFIVIVVAIGVTIVFVIRKNNEITYNNPYQVLD